MQPVTILMPTATESSVITSVALLGRFTHEAIGGNDVTVGAEAGAKTASILATAFELEKSRLEAMPAGEAETDSLNKLVALVCVALGPRRSTNTDEIWWKRIFIETDHPRQPKGAPNGGEFADNDGTIATGIPRAAIVHTSMETNADSELPGADPATASLEKDIARRAARRMVRTKLIAAARAVIGTVADVVPVAGEAFDDYEIAQTVVDFENCQTKRRSRSIS